MKRSLVWLLEHGGWLLLVLVACFFAVQSDSFLTLANMTNIGIQATSTALLAIGMTFVLITGGVDLSVGSIMFVAAAIVGKMVAAEQSLTAMILTMLLVGLLAGLINGLLVTQLRIVPFVATLGMLYVGRGQGLWISKTRAMNLPSQFIELGSHTFLFLPLPLWLLLLATLVAHSCLAHTPFGKQIMATGYSQQAADRAGIRTQRVILGAYVISGCFAALAALVSLTQIGAVSPTFGRNRELMAIAAAVLGGTSLFGGRGSIFPGAILGAIILQCAENGLVLMHADPYLFPIVTSAIIFVAVLLDGGRQALLESLQRRPIFTRPTSGSSADRTPEQLPPRDDHPE